MLAVQETEKKKKTRRYNPLIKLENVILLSLGASKRNGKHGIVSIITYTIQTRKIYLGYKGE